MYRRGDPRWNRTIQNITDTVEHANESAQEGLYSFTYTYVNPCFQSAAQCVNACTAPCFPTHNDGRRHRARSRGIAEQSFDFYDDWDEDESEGLLGWGNDNLDRLWGNSNHYGSVSQPGRQPSMSYGNRNRNRDPRFIPGRRKSAVQPHDGGPDPTVIPSSSYFGFLSRLPFKVGGKTLRYKPSAADLTEHPGQLRRDHDHIREESEPLIEESDENEFPGAERKGHGRKRSQTSTSRHTTDSLSSRGDIFPSEDELDDAVPLDDEFAVALERRITHDDTSSGKRTRSTSKGPPSTSRLSTRSASDRSKQESVGKRSDEVQPTRSTSPAVEEMPTLFDLQQEEEQLRLQEEGELDRKRQSAHRLALERGLILDEEMRGQGQVTYSSSNPNLSTTKDKVESEDLRPTTPPMQILKHDQDFDVPMSPPVDSQSMPESSAFFVDESSDSSVASIARPSRPSDAET